MTAYCDYIADEINVLFWSQQSEAIITKVGNVEYDLHPEQGWMMTTKKTIELTDMNGKMYRVTVEEING
jgi:hypothetical protein